MAVYGQLVKNCVRLPNSSVFARVPSKDKIVPARGFNLNILAGNQTPLL